MWVPLSDGQRASARVFLQAAPESSLQLWSWLEDGGAELWVWTEGWSAADAVEGVLGVSGSGVVAIQTAGDRARAERAALEVLVPKGGRLTDVMGEWEAAEALFQTLERRAGLSAAFFSKERLMRLDFAEVDGRREARDPDIAGDAPVGAAMSAADFDAYEPLRLEFLAEDGLVPSDTVEQRRARFERWVSEGRVHGAMGDKGWQATAVLSVLVGPYAQLGGVFTRKAHRRSGLGRAAVVSALDAARRRGVSSVVLFTEHRNRPAMGLYESLGFRPLGLYGLFWLRC